jgi:hypothetical protein
MFVYNTVIAASESTTSTAAMYTTSAVANTLVDHLRFLTAAGRAGSIQSCFIGGRIAAGTSITGISIRFLRFATASTAGTAASLRPRDPSAPTAVMTAFTAPTIGATPTLQVAFNCGASSGGGWTALNPDSVIYLAPGGGASGNVDMVSGTAGTVALGFDASVEHQE